MAFRIEDLILSIEASDRADVARLRLRGCAGRSAHFDVVAEIACKEGTAQPGLVPLQDPNGLEDLKRALADLEAQIQVRRDAQIAVRNGGA